MSGSVSGSGKFLPSAISSGYDVLSAFSWKDSSPSNDGNLIVGERNSVVYTPKKACSAPQ